MGSFWGYCGGYFAVIFRLFSGYFGAVLRSFLGHFGVILGLFLDLFGAILRSFLGHFGLKSGVFDLLEIKISRLTCIFPTCSLRSFQML